MDLRAIMYQNVYQSPIAKGEEEKTRNMLTELFHYYMAHPKTVSREYRELIVCQGEEMERTVCDYISGMTDQYSMDKFQELFVPKSWPVY